MPLRTDRLIHTELTVAGGQGVDLAIVPDGERWLVKAFSLLRSDTNPGAAQVQLSAGDPGPGQFTVPFVSFTLTANTFGNETFQRFVVVRSGSRLRIFCSGLVGGTFRIEMYGARLSSA